MVPSAGGFARRGDEASGLDVEGDDSVQSVGKRGQSRHQTEQSDVVKDEPKDEVHELKFQGEVDLPSPFIVLITNAPHGTARATSAPPFAAMRTE